MQQAARSCYLNAAERASEKYLKSVNILRSYAWQNSVLYFLGAIL